MKFKRLKFLIFLIGIPSLSSAFQAGGTGTITENPFRGGIFLSFKWREVDSPKGEKFTSIGTHLSLGISPKKWFCGYVFGGFSDMKFNAENFHSPLGPEFGAGMKFSVSPGSNVGLNLDGQFAYQHNSNGQSLNYYELQSFLTISYRYANLYVYGGLSISQSWLDFSSGGDYTANNLFGVVVGMDYFVTPALFMTTEMHNFDKDVIYIGVGFTP
jgi:hypothetical protein